MTERVVALDDENICRLEFSLTRLTLTPLTDFLGIVA